MRRAAGALALLLALVACSSSGGSDAGPPTSRPPAASTTTVVIPAVTAPAGDGPGAIFAQGYPKAAGGQCDSHEPGKAHVVMTFCHGPAELQITIGAASHTLAGVCWVNGGSFEFDGGTAPGEGWAGPWPDGATFRLEGSTGSYRDDLALFTFGGTRSFVTNANGTIGTGSPTAITPALVAATGFTVTLAGNDTLSQAEITATLTCS